MENEYNSIKLAPIATIHNDFKTKFGVPRQSLLSESLESTIEFNKEFSDVDYIRGLDGFSHIWLIWIFTDIKREKATPLVRPPRLGGNKKVGVFATRSPYRPNPLGMTLVKIKEIEYKNNFAIIHILGGDMMDGTEVVDIKPYLPYVESVPNAKEGFTKDTRLYHIDVNITDDLLSKIPYEKQKPLIETLSLDPRPAYKNDENEVYGFLYSDFNVRFKVKENILTVVDIEIM